MIDAISISIGSYLVVIAKNISRISTPANMNTQRKTLVLYFQKILPLFIIGILLGGCSGANTQNQQNANVEKQLEKRQYLQQLEEEPQKPSERNPEENEALGDAI